MPLDNIRNPPRRAAPGRAGLHRPRDRHERWDMSAQRYAYEASEYLRAAGLRELADDCGDEFGIDATAILAAIERELAQ